MFERWKVVGYGCVSFKKAAFFKSRSFFFALLVWAQDCFALEPRDCWEILHSCHDVDPLLLFLSLLLAPFGIGSITNGHESSFDKRVPTKIHIALWMRSSNSLRSNVFILVPSCLQISAGCCRHCVFLLLVPGDPHRCNVVHCKLFLNQSSPGMVHFRLRPGMDSICSPSLGVQGAWMYVSR